MNKPHGTVKRRANIPDSMHKWYANVSKADLAEALLDACALLSDGGCDDEEAAAAEAANKVRQAIIAGGRKPHRSLGA